MKQNPFSHDFEARIKHDPSKDIPDIDSRVSLVRNVKNIS
jgi:hypothetical protein